MQKSILILVVIFLSFNRIHGTPIQNPDYVYVRTIKAEEMRNFMNESVNPCEDFYEFACGNSHAVLPATPKIPRTDGYHVARTEWRRKVTLTLETRNNNDTIVEQKVKDFYESCLNLPALNVYQNKLKELIAEFGSMPALEGDKWQEDAFDWLKTISDIFYKLDEKIILGFRLYPDPEDSTVNMLRLTHPNLERPVVYRNQNKQKIYKKMIAENLKSFLGFNESQSQAVAQEIFDFEASLAEGDTSNDPLANVTVDYETYTASELQTKYAPHLDIKRMLRLSMDIMSEENIIILEPEYQENLFKVLQNAPKKAVANYIFYKLVVLFSPPTLEENMEKRQELCQEEVKKFLTDILENMTYRPYKNEETEKAVINMFGDLKSIFISALSSENQYSWMSRSSRRKAVKKVRAMKLKIGSYEDVDFMQKYGSLIISKTQFVDNLKSIRNLLGQRFRVSFKEIAKLEIQSTFTPQHILTENIIHVPVAILLHNVFWSSSLPAAFNLAKLGHLLGHEMLHGFDDIGSSYDLDGNLDEWWDRTSTRKFEQQRECFEHQVETYTLKGKPLPKTQFQSENIADAGGLNLVYQVYQQWFDYLSKPRQDMEALPNVYFKNKQLFFIAFAQTWCSDTLPNYVNYFLAIDPHLPAKFRINGPLSNLKEFANVYNCPKGSGMNPIEQCSIY